MSQVTRQTMVDDSGLFTDGTEVDKAFVDQIYDQIDDQAHSTTNPSIKPKVITDEVVAARGNLASLDARLSAVVDDDGVPVPSAGAVTQAEAGALPQTNVVLNETFLVWAAGDATAPTGWTLAGTGAACARAGTGLGDTKRKVGDFCAKLTYGSTVLTLSQDILPTAAFARVDHLQGTDVVLGAWVWANLASQTRLYITDGVSSGYSSYHTGNGTWQWLTVAYTLSGSATHLEAGVRVEGGAGNPVYFSGPTLQLSSLVPTNWRPTPMAYGTVFLPMPGVQTAGTDKGRYLLNRMGIVKDIQATLSTAPTGATTFKIDVNRGGTTMLGSVLAFVASDKAAAKQPDGTYSQRCFPGTRLASGTTLTDILSFDIDAIGNTIPGSDLTVAIRVMVYLDPFEAEKAA